MKHIIKKLDKHGTKYVTPTGRYTINIAKARQFPSKAAAKAECGPDEFPVKASSVFGG